VDFQDNKTLVVLKIHTPVLRFYLFTTALK